MGTCILDHTCQQVPLQKHTTGIRENPPKYWKNTSKKIISSKKLGKTLGKRLLPEPNRSWRPIPRDWKFQNHSIGQ